MAKDTPANTRNLVIYELYVRSHGPQGKFNEATADLARIRALGVDIVWLMPIHPIGKVARKGSLGSPYSIADYRAINPEYGSLDDFRKLVETAHGLGMKVMIDVVYNHTAHDSLLVEQHPDWFNQDAQGRPVTTVPDWSDVIDLKHPNAELSAYLIDCLKYWAGQGVDGFRCDVAPLVPLDFWVRARQAVAEVNPQTLWLAESVHASFVIDRRLHDLTGVSDGELYQAFDLTYDYDIWPVWQAAVKGKLPLNRYLDLLAYQGSLHPANAVKMRGVENHDNWRVMRLAPSRAQGLAWTAFQFFNQGAFLIYGGQESGTDYTPSLFEKEPVDWAGYPLSPFLTHLAALKKDPAQAQGKFILLDNPDGGIQAAWLNGEDSLYGVFNTGAQSGALAVQLADGAYTNLIDDQPVLVRGGKMSFPASATLLRVPIAGQPQFYRSELL